MEEQIAFTETHLVRGLLRDKRGERDKEIVKYR